MTTRASGLLTANFIEDVRVQVLGFLRDAGYSVQSDADAPRACEFYYNARKREVPARPRRVHVSRELRARSLGAADLLGLAAVRRASENGKDLTPFLSTKVVDPGFPDGLLNEWGIHHMHLGVHRRAKKGFVGRSRRVLCARIEANDLYQIDIIEHPPHLNFADERLLHIMDANWPDALASYRLAGVRPGRDAQYSSVERDRFRWKGLTVPTALRDGSVLFPPGGGFMSNRLSMEVRIRADRLLTQAHSLEEQCRTKAEAIKDQVERLSGRQLEGLVLALELRDPASRIVESQAGVTIWSGVL